MVTGWTPGGAVTIHTAVAGSAAFDEVWLYAYNAYGSVVNLNLYWGGTTVNDTEVLPIPALAGRQLVIDGRLINNGLVVSATAAQSGTNALLIDGFVNNIA